MLGLFLIKKIDNINYDEVVGKLNCLFSDKYITNTDNFSKYFSVEQDYYKMTINTIEYEKYMLLPKIIIKNNSKSILIEKSLNFFYLFLFVFILYLFGMVIYMVLNTPSEKLEYKWFFLFAFISIFSLIIYRNISHFFKNLKKNYIILKKINCS